MDLVEIKNANKAGIIPFYKDNEGVIRMLFMVPSDPYYGGSHLQIAKGGIDKGETAYDTAIREGIEELGLREDNVVQFCPDSYTELLTRRDGRQYTIEVFIAKIKDPTKFCTPHYETGRTEWLTIDQFKLCGRRVQCSIVMSVYAKISEME